MKTILLLFFFLLSSQQSIIGKSDIKHCFNSSKSTDCKNTLLLNLTLENNQKAGTEFARFTFKNFTDDQNNKISLNTPVTLEVNKSEVRVLYRIKYMRHFNGQIYERIVDTVWPFCSTGLLSSDGEILVDSTCGYKIDKENKPIDHSQGFCCTCPTLTLLTGISNEVTRGGCGLMSSSETAHCLEFGESYFAGYNIETYRFDYSVDISLKYESNGQQKEIKDTITVSERAFDNGIVHGKIVGDYLPSVQPPDLTGKVLFVPDNNYKEDITTLGIEEANNKDIEEINGESVNNETFTNSGVDYSDEANNKWLVVDKNMVTEDGLECNKIGVSYKAFQNQAGKCDVAAGSCLSNQIIDLLSTDNAKIASNKAPEYILTHKGKFTGITKDDDFSKLEMIFEDIFTTHVLIEIEADDFEFVTNLGKASIVSVEVKDFEAQKEIGQLLAKIKNIGDNKAEFEISVKCSDQLESVPSKLLSIDIGETINTRFSFSSFSSEEAEHVCELLVKNSRGTVVDSEEVGFKTIEREIVTNDVTKDEEQEDKVIRDENFVEKIEEISLTEDIICKYLCPEVSSAACFIVFGCSGEIKRLIYYGVIIVVIFPIIIFVLLRVCSCCLCPCFGFNRREETKREEYSVRDSVEEKIDNKEEFDTNHENVNPVINRRPSIKENETVPLNIQVQRTEEKDEKIFLKLVKEKLKEVFNCEIQKSVSFESKININSSFVVNFGYNKELDVVLKQIFNERDIHDFNDMVRTCLDNDVIKVIHQQNT